MGSEKTRLSSNHFCSYGDILRRQWINRVTHETKNLTTDHISSKHEVNITTTMPSNSLPSDSQTTRSGDKTTEAADTKPVQSVEKKITDCGGNACHSCRLCCDWFQEGIDWESAPDATCSYHPPSRGFYYHIEYVCNCKRK
ncbi:unnamed protein product [Adineta steineri]|uniref:Uncharacterized protein n=1 Tax=Adineta steineri TaxID=433720 RepID=A0A813XDW2_9BILA|nr:unnamed protein product [Adineta steineri]